MTVGDREEVSASGIVAQDEAGGFCKGKGGRSWLR
jgi:hypothetical protein